MSSFDVPLTRRGFGGTSRKDNWWVEPLLVFLGYMSFIVYATYAGMNPGTPANPSYLCTTQCGGADYLSPMYSPLLTETAPSWWPALLPFSAAMLILPFPAGFRFTCYYYRGAYYKAFWADPISCAVGEPRNTYRGEKKFPLVIQNVHRYFLYAAIIFVFILLYDGYRALWFTGPDGAKHFGIGLGSLVLILNPILLGLYTFGCHSFRHLVGGMMDIMSRSPLRRKTYDCVSCLNRSHMKWAWISMFFVGFADLYVRMCALGIWHDWRIL
jgi:hypothetical protein